MAQPDRRRRGRRPPRSQLVLRWLAVAALVLIAFLYYRPLRTYLDTRGELAARSREVQGLERKKRALEQRLAVSRSNEALEREARRLGYVKPGEQLFIVKGIERWRRARATIQRDGG